MATWTTVNNLRVQVDWVQISLRVILMIAFQVYVLYNYARTCMLCTRSLKLYPCQVIAVSSYTNVRLYQSQVIPLSGIAVSSYTCTSVRL